MFSYPIVDIILGLLWNFTNAISRWKIVSNFGLGPNSIAPNSLWLVFHKTEFNARNRPIHCLERCSLKTKSSLPCSLVNFCTVCFTALEEGHRIRPSELEGSQLLKKEIEFVHPSLKGFVYRSKTRFRCLRKKLAAKALVVYRARSVQIGHASRHCPRCQEDICRLLLCQKWRWIRT